MKLAQVVDPHPQLLLSIFIIVTHNQIFLLSVPLNRFARAVIPLPPVMRELTGADDKLSDDILLLE